MEIALEPQIPTYSGGLGVLAGDFLRAAADLDVALVGVCLVHRTGYFRQTPDAAGNQGEAPAPWPVETTLREESVRVGVEIENRVVMLRAWTFEVRGCRGATVPVYLLDADVEGNSPWDRRLTD